MKVRVGSRWRVYLVSSLIVVLVFAGFLLAPEFLTVMEWKFYDLHFALRGPRDPGDRVVVVAVDEKSLAARGRWPWPRSTLADLVTRISEAGARVVAIDVLLSEPEVSGESRVAARFAQRLSAIGMGPTTEIGRALGREVDTLAREADHDAQLEKAIRASGRVVLPLVFDLDLRPPAAPPEPRGPAYASALTTFRHYEERGLYPAPSSTRATGPLPRFTGAARALGHVTMLADIDGSTRWEAAVFEYGGRYYPSLALQAVRVGLGLDETDLRLDFGREVTVGALSLPLDPRNRVLVNYAGPGGTFRHISAVDVLDGRTPAEALRDRIVFVGTTAEGTYDLRVTPTSPVLPGVEKHANVAADLLGARPLYRPAWVELVEAASIVFWPTFLAWLLPRLRPAVSLGAAALAWVAFFGATHLAFLRGLWIPVVYPSLAMFLSPVAIMGYLYLTEERRRHEIKRAFQRFVSPEIVEKVAADPAALQFGGEVRTLTVLFSDIRGFTAYTERHEPQEVVHMLREFFTRMVDRIFAHQGTLDKFVGDAVMAIFGAPLPLADHAERACRAALAMVEELDKLQAKWAAEGREPFRIGIGINTGEMVVGNLGSEQLFAYTVVGDAVNLGARLEALTREYEVLIVISESTFEAARAAIRARRLGEVRVKGRARPVVAYELLGLAETGPGREADATSSPVPPSEINGVGPTREWPERTGVTAARGKADP